MTGAVGRGKSVSAGIVRNVMQDSTEDIKQGVLTCVLPSVELHRKGKYVAIGGIRTWELWYAVLSTGAQDKHGPFVYENVEFHRSTVIPPRQFYIVEVLAPLG